MKAIVGWLAGMLLGVTLVAQEYRWEVKTDRTDAIYKQGETITFSAVLLKNGQPAAGKNVVWQMIGDGTFRKTGSYISEKTPFTVTAALAFPGWVQVTFTLAATDGAPVTKTTDNPRTVTTVAAIGAMVDPLGITAVGQEPGDFDAFWRACRAEVDAVPLKAALVAVEVAAPDAGKVAGFEVKIACAGGRPVSGYLAKPAGAAPHSLPAIVFYHGAGVQSAALPCASAAAGAIALEVNAHGIDNGQPAGFYQELKQHALKNYPHRNKQDRDQFYFKGMYMRVMRSLDYVKSLPEWDGKHLIVVGGSQGGAQALVAAALEPCVTLCLAGVPALCDQAGGLATPPRQPGWPRLYGVTAAGRPDNAAVANVAAYYDLVYFARRVRCETYISAGFIDDVCVPTSVYAAYNQLPATIRKAMSAAPGRGHLDTRNTLGSKRMDEYLREIRAAAKK